mmetsp:Transcript_26521/g.76569  ORF Transcript_26521/g.76569 Transcript_26521/m.76569 type:complete len:287 (-) Transcript_26521:273-1133(-)
MHSRCAHCQLLLQLSFLLLGGRSSLSTCFVLRHKPKLIGIGLMRNFIRCRQQRGFIIALPESCCHNRTRTSTRRRPQGRQSLTILVPQAYDSLPSGGECWSVATIGWQLGHGYNMLHSSSIAISMDDILHHFGVPPQLNMSIVEPTDKRSVGQNGQIIHIRPTQLQSQRHDNVAHQRPIVLRTTILQYRLDAVLGHTIRLAVVLVRFVQTVGIGTAPFARRSLQGHDHPLGLVFVFHLLPVAFGLNLLGCDVLLKFGTCSGRLREFLGRSDEGDHKRCLLGWQRYM